MLASFIEYVSYGRTNRLISPVNAAQPTAGSAHSFFQFVHGPFYVLFSRFVFSDECYPADPFIAGEGSELFPLRKCPWVGCQRIV